MHIGIVDADLVGRKKHRFPNLACMKISTYYKERGHDVQLVTNYKDLYYDENLWIDYQNAIDKYIKQYLKKNSEELGKCSEELGKCMVPCFDKSNIKFDKIFISKVFTDTEIDEDFLTLDIVEYGGTGFYFDKAPNLSDEIEHSKPDYDLYKEWIDRQIKAGVKPLEFKEYTDYSIGFITRGCFRKCAFCVNQKYNKVFEHSPLSEFLDPDKPKICLLDDNFLGCPNWKELLHQLKATGKPFKFKQGLDERLLTEEKCLELFSSKYDGEFTFAFDNIADREIIEKKLELIREHTDRKNIKFYVFCGFNHDNLHSYTEEFWANDIRDLFERMRILAKYRCLPYVMRYKDYELSPYRGMYINVARWANQPSFYKKKSFYEYCTMESNKGRSTEKYMIEFMEKYPDIANEYFYLRWEEL